jgi:hypothetical protein
LVRATGVPDRNIAETLAFETERDDGGKL